jgi:hypothetical protein
MPLYKVTFTLSQKELLEFLEQKKTTDAKIEVIQPTEQQTPLPASHENPTGYEPARTRAKRGSKVVDTILETLNGGVAGPNQLKKALAAAGLSENSLSTGVAILQKAGKISRDANGDYIAHQDRAA